MKASHVLRLTAAAALLAGAWAGCGSKSSSESSGPGSLPPATLSESTTSQATAQAVQSMDLTTAVASASVATPSGALGAPPQLMAKALHGLSLGARATATDVAQSINIIAPQKPHNTGEAVAFVTIPLEAAITLAVLHYAAPNAITCVTGAVTGTCPDETNKVTGSCTITADVPAGCISFPDKANPGVTVSVSGSVTVVMTVSSFAPKVDHGSISLNGFSISATSASSNVSVAFDGSITLDDNINVTSTGGGTFSTTVAIPTFKATVSDGTILQVTNVSMSDSGTVGSSYTEALSGGLSYTSPTQAVWNVTLSSNHTLTNQGPDAFAVSVDDTLTINQVQVFNQLNGTVSNITRDQNGNVTQITVNGNHTWGMTGVGKVSATAKDLVMTAACPHHPSSGTLTLTSGSDSAVITFSGACSCSASAEITTVSGNTTSISVTPINICSTENEFGS